MKYHRNGLKEISQIFDSLRFKSPEEMFERYGVSVTDYNTLVSVISAALKRSPGAVSLCGELKVYAFIESNRCSKEVYGKLQDRAQPVDNTLKKWKEILGPTDELEFLDPQAGRVLTNIPKYRSFQYRL